MVRYVKIADCRIIEVIRIEDAKNISSRIAAEYKYLIEKYGVLGKDWELLRQALIREKDGRSFDELDIKFPDGTMKIIYFDITSNHRKLPEKLREVRDSL